MDYLSLDLLIVIAFLLISLGIGLSAGRGIKDIRDYALANRSFSTTALTLTYLATYTGSSSLLGDSREIFTDGIILTAMALGIGLSYVLKAIFIAPHMHHFKGCLTLGDVVGSLYGINSKVVAASFSLFASIIVLGMELHALGIVCTELLDINASWGIIAGGLILATYSAIGGIRAVTTTDIFQFLVLFAVIPLITAITLSKAGGFIKVVEAVPVERFAIWGHDSFWLYLTFFLAFGLFSVEMTNLTGMQRMLMARDGRQLRDMFFASALFDASFRIIVMILALSGLALYPHIAPDTVVTHIFNELLPVGIKGLAIASVLAMIMATGDSHLHAAGLSIAHDIIQPLAQRYKLVINELRWARYTTFSIGWISIWIGLKGSRLLSLELEALGFIGPTLSVPLIAGIIGLKPSQRVFYTALGATLTVFFGIKFLLPASQQYLALLFGLLTNTIVFLGMHWLENQGFAWAERPQETTLEVRSAAPNRPRSLLEYAQQKVAQYGAPSRLFGFFCCVNFTMPYFMWVNQTPGSYDIVPYLRLLGAMMGGLLIVKEKWPRSLLPYFSLFWYFTLFYCIPFTSTLMFLLTQGSVEWLINVAITIMFLIVLVDWSTFFLLTIVGIVSSFLFYSIVIGPVTLQLSFSSSYLLVYQGVFATLIGLLFARRKEQRITQERSFLKGQSEAYQADFLQATAENKATLTALQHTGADKLLSITRKLHLAAGDKAQTEALQEELIPIAFQLQGIDVRIKDYLRLHITQDHAIEQLLSTVRERLQKGGLKATLQIVQQARCKQLTCDPEQLENLLTKSIMALQGVVQEEEQSILLSLADTQLSYPLPDVKKGYIKYVPAVRIAITTTGQEFPPLAESYQPELNGAVDASQESAQGLHAFAHHRIIKSHYGYAAATDQSLVYVVPADLEEVRPKDMDKAYMEVDATPERADDHFKNDEGIYAQVQEASFLNDVATRSQADLSMVKMALETIKWYHGPKNRYSGEPFYLHPLAVAQIVLDYNQDEATIIGALLHDTVEDTPMQLRHIEKMFGQDIVEVVDVVTHLQSVEGSIYKVKLSASENLQMLERTGNQRGLYVKLADRMHNMRTIKGHKKASKRKRIAEETMQFFVPLADKLGLNEAAREFEKMCVEVFKMKD